MAKRYHQTRKDRRDERRGMERKSMHALREMDNSDPVPTTVSGLTGRRAYMGNKESRRQMRTDSDLIREDMSAPALQPRHVIEKYFPRSANYNMGYVEDLFYGVQKQMHEDYDDLGRELGPKKY